MKKRFRITVTSARSLFAMDLFPPEDAEDLIQEEEEADDFWNHPEDLWLNEKEGPLPSDRGEALIETPSLPPATATTLTSHGLFSKEEDGSFRLSYEDTEITGLEGCLTTFCLSATGMLIMLRRGTVKTCMVFEEGHRHLCDYGAAGGAPTVFLHTHTLSANLDENGGTLQVEYSVELQGIRTERNSLSILVEKAY